MTRGVYLLRDPFNGIVRYVGQSSNVESRTRAQSYVCSANPSIKAWVEDLQMQGARPEVVVIPIPGGDLDAVERFLISQHHTTVLNRTFGGVQRPELTPLADRFYLNWKFYQVRNEFSNRMRARLRSRGVPDWRTYQEKGYGNEIYDRASRYALKKLQRPGPYFSLFDGLKIEDIYQHAKTRTAADCGVIADAIEKMGA